MRRLLLIACLCALSVTALAQQSSFNGGMAYYPPPSRAINWLFDTTTNQINASGEVVVLVAKMPQACVIDRLGTIISAVANAPDNGLRFSLQGVSATTGLNDGTIIESTNAFATVASGSVATGWLASGAFATNHTATRGELLAFVLDIPTFTAGDDLIVRSMANGSSATTVLPYAIREAAGTRSTHILPIIIAHCADGGAGTWLQLSPLIIPATAALTGVTFDTGTTPDEMGAVFIPAQPSRLNSVIIPIATDAAASDFDVIVYDSGDNVLDTVSYDGDQVGNPANTSVIHFEHWLSASLTLTAGATYRIVVKPTTTNNVRLSYLPIADAAIEAVPGDLVNFYVTTRVDAGAWTDYDNAVDGYRYPSMYLGFDAFSGAASSGGGRIIGGHE